MLKEEEEEECKGTPKNSTENGETGARKKDLLPTVITSAKTSRKPPSIIETKILGELAAATSSFSNNPIVTTTSSFSNNPVVTTTSSKQRSMSVTVNPRVEYIDRGTARQNPHHPPPFARANSLQVSMLTVDKRPTIPTGNMLTESLMAAAAAERSRKKSVAASIRYLAAEKANYDFSFYAILVLLVVVSVFFVLLAVMHFTEGNGGCEVSSSENDTQLQQQQQQQQQQQLKDNLY